MPSFPLPASIVPDSAPASLPRSATRTLAAVFLPKEHGSWSLVFEPLALGLLVAPSCGGTALATAALAGFFSRRPLKSAFHPDSTDRRRTARITVVLLATLAVAGLLEAALIGGLTALWPLLFAAPLAAAFLYFDAQNDSRAAAAELAGCAAFAFLPAALATLSGWSAPAALALTALTLARGIPTILTVRSYLRLNKQQPAGILLPLLTGGLAVAGLSALAAHQLVPWLAAGFAALFLLRTTLFVSSLRPIWPASGVGKIEALLGALYTGGLALAYHLR